jgi:hypothetical protein
VSFAVFVAVFVVVLIAIVAPFAVTLIYYAISLTWVLPALVNRLRGRADNSHDCAILISVS